MSNQILFNESPVTVQNRIMRYDVDMNIEWGNTEQNPQTDLLPIFENAGKPYETLIDVDQAAFKYFRLGELSGTTATDTGSSPQNGTYNTDCSSMVTTGALNGNANAGALTDTNNKAQRFGKPASSSITANPSMTVSGFDISNGRATSVRTAFSVSFWFKPVYVTTFQPTQLISNYVAYTGGSKEVAWDIYIVGSVISFRIPDVYTNPYNSLFAAVTTNGALIEADTWHHICFTVTADGVYKAYVNGQLINTVTKPAAKFPVNSVGMSGIKLINSGSKKLDVCYSGLTRGRALDFCLDELAFWIRELSTDEVMHQFKNGKYSDAIYTYTTGPVVPPDRTSPYITPALSGGEDITQYVSTWGVDRQSAQLVDQLTMEIRESFGIALIKTLFRTNTYITIEQRFIQENKQLDTGWLDVGHFLVDGPGDKVANASGDLVYRVNGRSMVKLASLDLISDPLEPDLIVEPRRELTQVASNSDRTIFRMDRPGTTPTQYYSNWADEPTVRVWGIGPFSDPALDDATDQIPIRGGANSVQVVGGGGELRVSTEFLTDTVKLNGLGGPTTVEASLYRFATTEDIVYGSITGYSILTIPSGLRDRDRIPYEAYFTVDTSTETQISDFNFIDSTNLDSYKGRTFIIKEGASAGRIYTINRLTFVSGTTWRVYVTDPLTREVPDIDGIDLTNAVGQITDANLVEDVVLKLLLRSGFQICDATAPFYLSIGNPRAYVQVPPIRYTLEDKIKKIDVLAEVLEYAPPDWKLKAERDGTTTFTTVQQEETPDYVISEIMDVSEDRSDANIYTEVVAIGRAYESVNMAIHQDYGGFLACGAYKKTDVKNAGTVTQQVIDGHIKRLFDLNPKTPDLVGDGLSPGLIWEKTSSKYWTWNGLDVFWFDIGKNTSTGNEWLVDAIEFAFIPTFVDTASTIPQIISIYHMTEADYIGATAHVPDAVPSTPTYVTGEYHGSDDATKIHRNMVTLEDSYLWKPLVDMEECKEGANILEASNFIGKKSIRTRFLKIKIDQPHFKFASTTGQSGTSRIDFTQFKLWLDTKIIQSAKYGYDMNFATTADKRNASRFRRRRFVLDENPSLNTPTICKQFARKELVERVAEFSPKTITCIAPEVDIYDTVSVLNEQTGTYESFFVMSVKHSNNLESNLTVVNYRNLELY